MTAACSTPPICGTSFLPFEGAGAISSWTLTLPQKLRSFDYITISDVILHICYTAREAGDPLGSQATKELVQTLSAPGQSSQALMFNLRYDFPNEWSALVNGTGHFTTTLRKDYFPYMVQTAQISINRLTLYADSRGTSRVDAAKHGPSGHVRRSQRGGQCGGSDLGQRFDCLDT
jgi:hypothetical protein